MQNSMQITNLKITLHLYLLGILIASVFKKIRNLLCALKGVGCVGGSLKYSCDLIFQRFNSPCRPNRMSRFGFIIQIISHHLGKKLCKLIHGKKLLYCYSSFSGCTYFFVPLIFRRCFHVCKRNVSVF